MNTHNEPVSGELPPSEIIRIFVENGTHSEDGDNAGYMRIREADALKIGRALIAALLSAKPEPAGERGELMKLADEYANAESRAQLEGLYGASKSYSKECIRIAREKRDALSAALLAADAQRPALKPLTDDLGERALRGKYGAFLNPFVAFMDAELHANAGKEDRAGWLGMSRETALLEIYYHLAKLQKAVKRDDIGFIVEHSADVANMSMMLLDICGGLPVAGKEAAHGIKEQA